jgi:hypothetical protein
VGVGGDARHPRNPEIEGGDRVAELFGEGEQETAEAAVDVAADTPLAGDGAQLTDRVDGPVPVVAGGADHCQGGVVDVVRDPVEVDQCADRVDRAAALLDAQQVAGLGERGVGRLGHDQVRVPPPRRSAACSR